MDISVYSTVPPGFRFHPTEEELVGYYLKRKIDSLKIDLEVIADIDLYKIEPWDIQERCKLGYEEQSEWYFFSHKDRKYPTGTRTNRATAAGFWKATGRDKAVLSNNKVIGMRKTLVFYKGRAPNGLKSDWIMHEYRLQNSHHAPTQEEGWVVCRAFRKAIPNQRPGLEAWNLHACYVKHDHSSWPPPDQHNNNFHDRNSNHRFISYDRPNIIPAATASASASAPDQHHFHHHHHLNIAAAASTASRHNSNSPALLENPPHLMDLPQLNSPTTTTDLLTNSHVEDTNTCEENSHTRSSVIDWRNLDSLLATNMASYDDPFLGCFTSNS